MPAMKARMRHHLAALVALGLVGWAAVVSARAPSWPERFETPPAAPRCTGAPLFDIGILHSAAPNYGHAISVVALKSGGLRAFWYEGEHELAPDVKIFSAVFDGTGWSTPVAIVDSAQTRAASGRRVKSLGNTIAWRVPGGDLVLVYASIGVGRWSGASLNVMRSRDEGETWTKPQRLVTTPTLNVSTLVRSPALAMSGGFTLVPAYQEFLRRFPEVILFDEAGQAVARRRIDNRFGAIQPLIVVMGPQEAIAFSRTSGAHDTLISDTSDAGWSWRSRDASGIPNFDKPVAAVRLDTGELLAVHSEALPGTRQLGPFVFAISSDKAESWRTISTLKLNRPGQMMHYPTLIATADGTYHLLFTHSLHPGSELMHVRFNRDWIAQNGGPACR